MRSQILLRFSQKCVTGRYSGLGVGWAGTALQGGEAHRLGLRWASRRGAAFRPTLQSASRTRSQAHEAGRVFPRWFPTFGILIGANKLHPVAGFADLGY